MLKAKLVVKADQALPLHGTSLRQLINKAGRHPVAASQRKLVLEMGEDQLADWLSQDAETTSQLRRSSRGRRVSTPLS